VGLLVNKLVVSARGQEQWYGFVGSLFLDFSWKCSVLYVVVSVIDCHVRCDVELGRMDRRTSGTPTLF